MIAQFILQFIKPYYIVPKNCSSIVCQVLNRHQKRLPNYKYMILCKIHKPFLTFVSYYILYEFWLKCNFSQFKQFKSFVTCIERRFFKVGFILMNHLSMYFRYFGIILFEAVSKRGISRLLGRCWTSTKWNLFRNKSRTQNRQRDTINIHNHPGEKKYL